MPSTAVNAPERVLLAAPRGYCAGVDRAVQTVEHALELHGPPVYVRKEIVHNKHVVEQLTERGAIFVDQETEVPEGELVVFSAHGVAPAVHENSARRNLRTIDATCPLVTKVHVEARRFAEQGFTIILVGHDGHEEVEGTTGEAPDSIILVESAEDVDALEVDDPDRVALITQTTLSVDETADIIARLREKFPNITTPKSDDICYATTNRQLAVKQLAKQCDLVLVVGSKNSSNSNRLVDVTRELGTASYLIDNAGEVQEEWLEGVDTVGSPRGRARPRSSSRSSSSSSASAARAGRRGAPRDRRGRPLHASEADPRRARRRGRLSEGADPKELAPLMGSWRVEATFGDDGPRRPRAGATSSPRWTAATSCRAARWRTRCRTALSDDESTIEGAGSAPTAASPGTGTWASSTGGSSAERSARGHLVELRRLVADLVPAGLVRDLLVEARLHVEVAHEPGGDEVHLAEVVVQARAAAAAEVAGG